MGFGRVFPVGLIMPTMAGTMLPLPRSDKRFRWEASAAHGGM
jgi:hypothetical protein